MTRMSVDDEVMLSADEYQCYVQDNEDVMTRKDSGPAFPQSVSVPADQWAQFGDPGLSKRDYFAGQAIVGILASGTGWSDKKHMAASAYAIADVMLEEREK